MKIRTDFVTNSSSVSYIITMNEDMAEFIKTKTKNYNEDIKKVKIYDALQGDLKTNGKKISIDNTQVYYKQYDFEKKPDCKYNFSFDKPVEEIDFSQMGDDELWSYIYGEYFVNARLSTEFKGFGTTQVPRDRDKLLAKLHALDGCAQCEKKDTDKCSKVIKKN